MLSLQPVRSGRRALRTRKPPTRQRSGRLRTFFAIADRWGLTENERLLTLGAPSRSTYYGWVKAARDHRDLTLPTEGEGTDWLRGPHQNQPFAGQPPIALITGGIQDGLMAVRRFLDAARGGQWMAPNDADLAEPMTDTDIVFA